MWGWILHFTPEKILSLLVFGIFSLGILLTVVGFLGKKIPFLSALIPGGSMGVLAAKILGILLLFGGSWFKGCFDVEMVWRDQAAKIEAKLKIAELKSKEKNIEIQKEYIHDTQIVHDVKIVVQEKIKEVEKIIDGKCTVDQSAIDILNQSALNLPPDRSSEVTVPKISSIEKLEMPNLPKEKIVATVENKIITRPKVEPILFRDESGPGWARGNIDRNKS
jgi:hypothetical protein